MARVEAVSRSDYVKFQMEEIQFRKFPINNAMGIARLCCLTDG